MKSAAIRFFAPTHIRYRAFLPTNYFAAYSLKTFYDLYPDRDQRQLRSKLLRHLGLPPQQFAWAQQVHGNRISEVRKPGLIADADGLVTNKFELFLTVAVADCLPIYLWCENPNAIALLHAGWRGSAAGIASRGVRMMNKLFGCESRTIGALLGPAICCSCYQVGPEVARLFDASDLNHDRDSQYFLDLRRVNRRQLEEAGIESGNILIDELCTRCHPELLFSHRREGKETGRMIAVLGMMKASEDRIRN